MRLSVLVLSAFLVGCGHQFSQDEIPLNISGVDADVLQVLKERADRYKDNAPMQYRLALELDRIGEEDEALSYVNRAIALEPNTTEYFVGKARILAAYERNQQLLSVVNKALELGSTSSEMNLLRGLALYKLGRYAEAKSCLDSIVKSKDYRCYLWGGMTNLQLSDTATAIKKFNRSIELNPQATEPMFMLVDVYLAKEQVPMAEFYLNEIEARDRGKQKYRDAQIRYQSLLGNLDSARFYLKEGIRFDSSGYQYQYQLSHNFFEARQYDSSAYYAQLIPEGDGQYLAARFILAKSLDRSREFSKAITIYQQIVAKDSSNNLAVQELDILKRKVAYLWQLRNQQQESSSEEAVVNEE